MKTALLLINLQLGFFENDPPVYRAEAVLEKVKLLINKAHRVARAGIPVIYVQHDANPEHDGPIHPHIAPAEKDVVILKYTANAFHDTGLQAELDRMSVKALVIAGFQSETSIHATCCQAVELGYQITLVEDAHSTHDGNQSAAEIIQDVTLALKSHVIVSQAAAIKFSNEVHSR